MVSEFADVNGYWDSDVLSLSWTTKGGAVGACTLQRSKADTPSALVPLVKEWVDYKAYVDSLEGKRYLFRGQTEPWRLRSSFHRAGRADLTRFVSEDIQALHKHLSARTKHVFNLEIPNENGAFFNLVQHHGYPTPLLDWTYSPYVAVFFAFRSITGGKAAKAKPEDKVRILVFDQAQWKADFKQVHFPSSSRAACVDRGVHCYENKRMIPSKRHQRLRMLTILSRTSSPKSWLTRNTFGRSISPSANAIRLCMSCNSWESLLVRCSQG